MNFKYYGVPIKDQGELVLALTSSSTFRSAKLMESRHNSEALVIVLYQQLENGDDENYVTLRSIESAELSEPQRLKAQAGHLMEITYPWGSQFVEQLESLVVDLGLESYQDPFKEGSDSFGILVGQSDDLWEVAPLLDERAEYCDENPDDEDAPWTMEDKIYEACQANNVVWLDTDWKHFEVDITDFKTLGLEVEYTEPIVISQPEGLVIDEVKLTDRQKYHTINLLFKKEDSSKEV